MPNSLLATDSVRRARALLANRHIMFLCFRPNEGETIEAIERDLRELNLFPLVDRAGGRVTAFQIKNVTELWSSAETSVPSYRT